MAIVVEIKFWNFQDSIDLSTGTIHIAGFFILLTSGHFRDFKFSAAVTGPILHTKTQDTSQVRSEQVEVLDTYLTVLW